MPRKDKEAPEADESFVELDSEYEFGGDIYGPGRVKIEGRQARRAILRAMDNAKEEHEAKAEETSEVVP